jgi:hypothetical protein
VNSIPHQFEKATTALQQLHDTLNETPDTHEDAARILKGIEKFEFIALL